MSDKPIQRYDTDPDWILVESPDGEYVKFSDHEAELKARDDQSKRSLSILEDVDFQIMQGRWNADKRVREQVEKAIVLLKPSPPKPETDATEVSG